MKDRDKTMAWGVEEIAEAIEEPNLGRVYYLLRKGEIPGARKFGGRWGLSIPTWRRAIHGDGEAA